MFGGGRYTEPLRRQCTLPCPSTRPANPPPPRPQPTSRSPRQNPSGMPVDHSGQVRFSHLSPPSGELPRWFVQRASASPSRVPPPDRATPDPRPATPLPGSAPPCVQTTVSLRRLPHTFSDPSLRRTSDGSRTALASGFVLGWAAAPSRAGLSAARRCRAHLASCDSRPQRLCCWMGEDGCEWTDGAPRA